LADALPGYLDAGKVLKDLEDATAWAGCIVVELVGECWICELEESLPVHLIIGTESDDVKEGALGNRGEVEIVGK